MNKMEHHEVMSFVKIHSVYSFCFTALLVGICATINLRIQAVNICIHYYIDMYLNDVMLVLSWGARK